MPSQWATTHWSLVVAAGESGEDDARAALGRLCETYYPPTYAFLRRRGHSEDNAEDLAQAFFLSLLQRKSLASARQERGRFRSFLLGALRNFLANERESARTQKRGGGQAPLSLDAGREGSDDRDVGEPIDVLTPERLFEERWAVTLLGEVLANLREEMARAGKEPLFERLRHVLTGEQGISYREVADELEMTEGSVKVAAHRLRKRFGRLLRDEVAHTVDRPEDVDDELRHLLNVLSSRR